MYASLVIENIFGITRLHENIFDTTRLDGLQCICTYKISYKHNEINLYIQQLQHNYVDY